MHTPGPWAIKWHENTDGYTIYVKGRNWESWGIADICHTKEDEHNARLIAKAPDLRDALAWALDQIEDDLDPDHQAALAHARSLLED